MPQIFVIVEDGCRVVIAGPQWHAFLGLVGMANSDSHWNYANNDDFILINGNLFLGSNGTTYDTKRSTKPSLAAQHHPSKLP
jgi:hypothetical protein